MEETVYYVLITFEQQKLDFRFEVLAIISSVERGKELAEQHSGKMLNWESDDRLWHFATLYRDEWDSRQKYYLIKPYTLDELRRKEMFRQDV